MFRLCPRGERIKLCGRAAGWRWESVGYVIMSILPPVVPQICAAPVTPKEAPGLCHRDLIKLTVLPWGQGCIALLAVSKVWVTAKEGQLKGIYCEATGSVCAWE